jgi:hypothetical protein
MTRARAASVMSSESDWVFFESRGDSASAALLRAQLELEGIATRLQVHGVPGLSSFNVLVPAVMLHRARWLSRQQPPSDTELESLATGCEPGEQPQE